MGISMYYRWMLGGKYTWTCISMKSKLIWNPNDKQVFKDEGEDGELKELFS